MGERVKAVYNFKGSHNDELQFRKGDVITLTQKEDGGWWEGTLHGKTGWFPANYVKAVSASAESAASAAAAGPSASSSATADQNLPLPLPPDDLSAQRRDYREQVVKDLLEKEQEFVRDLQRLRTQFLEPMQRASILTDAELSQLVGNLDELIDVHHSLNAAIDDEMAHGQGQGQQGQGQQRAEHRRLGRVFLGHGAKIRSAHLTYWTNHPRAVCILERHRDKLDKFMEAHGASSPGLMVLTTSLSKPFRHLEKYPALTLELEQQLEDDHPDRGDTQRSIAFYKSVASECAKQRRQKELELEVLTGAIRDWEGDSIHTLGDIVHVGPVAILAAPSGGQTEQQQQRKDRYLVLFPANLLILSASARMSAFIYEGKLPLPGIAVNRLEDTEAIANSFEVTGPMIERIVVMCQTKSEAARWLDCLQSQIKFSRQPTSYQQQPPPAHNAPNNASAMSPASQNKRPNNVGVGGKGYLWKMSCLRPAPPTRAFIAQDGRRTIKKKDPDTTYEEDMQILRVIEAYCTSNKRHTQATSTLIEAPAVVTLADEDKTSIEENGNGSYNGSSSGNNASLSPLEERNVADTVFAIRDQVVLLRQQNKELARMLEDEIGARKRLEQMVRSSPQHAPSATPTSSATPTHANNNRSSNHSGSANGNNE